VFLCLHGIASPDVMDSLRLASAHAFAEIAPPPPQADAPPRRQPMTETEITNIIPAHFVPSGVKTFWSFARDIEAHHEIGVKP
jgi:hypothetical protein